MSLSRSVYLSKLRRAFLLKIHPDRFRNHSASVRTEQATLMSALENRFSDQDFIVWQQNNSSSYNHRHHLAGVPPPSPFNTNQNNNDNNNNFPYIVEKRDGSFLRTSIQLNGSVEQIIESITETLKGSGVAPSSLPAPPPTATLDNHDEVRRSRSHFHQRFEPSDEQHQHYNHHHYGGGGRIDHRFDVQSRQGRDLFHFFETTQSTLNDEILQRRKSRMDAQAAAMEVRRLYRFQSVDATTLGWSSASVAVLLSQLLAFHEEHSSKFKVNSFYPSTLLFTSDEYRNSLDVYGGVIRINPAMTPLQWLEAMQQIKKEHLELIRQNRSTLIDMTKFVQGSVGVKLKKGNSCTSPEYFEFVRRLYEGSSRTSSNDQDETASSASSSLILEPVTVTVESSQACRRPIVTKEGTIRIGTNMAEVSDVCYAVTKLAGQAREKSNEHSKKQQLCTQVIEQMQWVLGLQRVYRLNQTVSTTEFLNCISRILHVVSDEGQHHQTQHQIMIQLLKAGLAGNSLGIANSGHFCHLADE